MLPKRQRLSRKEFEALLKKGTRLHGEYMTLVYTPAKNKKYGVVVSKKTARNATARNHVRRRAYTVCKEYITTLPLAHVAVLTKKNVTTLSFQELREQLAALLGQIRSTTS